MSKKQSNPKVIGIDIGKNSFHCQRRHQGQQLRPVQVGRVATAQTERRSSLFANDTASSITVGTG